MKGKEEPLVLMNPKSKKAKELLAYIDKDLLLKEPPKKVNDSNVVEFCRESGIELPPIAPSTLGDMGASMGKLFAKKLGKERKIPPLPRFNMVLGDINFGYLISKAFMIEKKYDGDFPYYDNDEDEMVVEQARMFKPDIMAANDDYREKEELDSQLHLDPIINLVTNTEMDEDY